MFLLPWQLIIIITLVILCSLFILATRNTIYCLLGLISLVLSLAWFLVYAGLELIGFMLSIIYLGAILVFFIFVIMLIDLRFEDLQAVYDDARTYEPQDYTVVLPLTLFSSMVILNYTAERILYKEYSGLEYLLLPADVAGLEGADLDLMTEYFLAFSWNPTAVGFFLFSSEGTAVGVISLLIFFSLYVSLITVYAANEVVLFRLEVTSWLNFFASLISRLIK